MKQMQSENPHLRMQQLEDMEEKRIEERMMQRHKTKKSKYLKNLARFSGDKNAVQNSINELNRIRKELL